MKKEDLTQTAEEQIVGQENVGSEVNTAFDMEETIPALQEKAAEALNKLLEAMVKEGIRVILPIQFYAISFEVKDDETTGFRFEPNNLSELPEVPKYSERDSFDTKTVQKPMDPKLVVASHGGSKVKVITKGVGSAD